MRYQDSDIKQGQPNFELTRSVLPQLHPCFDGHCTHERKGADEQVLQNETYKWNVCIENFTIEI